MKPLPKTLVLGLAALTGAAMAQSPPDAKDRAATVSEAGPPVSGDVLAEPQVVELYTFDSAPGVNDGADLDGWTDLVGQSEPSSQVFSGGGANDGGRGWGQQDAAHATLVMSSPPFLLETDMAITFDLAGGQATANFPADLASLPANSDASGVQCMALRRTSDDTYVAWARRSGNGNGYQSNGWDTATIAGIADANPGEVFSIDWIDSFSGSWGFGMVDNVAITVGATPQSAPLFSPPTQIQGNPGYGSTLEGTLNDPFAYNPTSPTNPLPILAFGANLGYHENSTNVSTIIIYDLETPLVEGDASDIVVDLYGRNSNQDRDNDVDVEFLDSDGNVLGVVMGAEIPPGTVPFLRITSTEAMVPDAATVAKVRITGHDSDATPAATNNFTLMELRVAQVFTPPQVTAVNGETGNVGTEVTLPSGALVTVNADGTYTYDPNGAIDAPSSGTTDSFDYSIDYGVPGTSSTATVTISVLDADAITYVDDDWAALNPGDPIADADQGTTGAQPATFGTDAFATIGEASFAANPSSRIVLNSGTYAGTTVLSDNQILVITGPDAPGSVTIDELLGSFGTTLDIQGASVLTLSSGTISGIITGSGSLVKDGSTNQLLLGNANTYAGTTTISSGRIQFTGTGSLGTGDVTVTSSGQIYMTNSLVNNVTIEGNGWPEAAGELGAIRFQNTTLTGDVTVGAAGARILARGGTGTIVGNLTGTAALEVNDLDAPNNGSITLDGDGSGYTGNLTISNGRFNMGPNLGGSVVVEDGATIGGEGTIAGDLQLGTTDGVTGAGLAIDPTTPETLSATNITLAGVLTTIAFDGAAAPGVTIPIVDYTTGFTDNSGAASLTEAFDAAGGRAAISDNPGTAPSTLELIFAVESSTWTAETTDNWEVGGPDTNWSSSDTFFFNGDSVLFDDTVGEFFTGTVTVIGNPQPVSITLNNSLAQDYTFVQSVAGNTIAGAGDLTKNGDGNVYLDIINSSTGSLVVNDGLLEINNQVRNMADFTVNAPGTLVTSTVNFLVPNHATALADSVVFTADGGTWICDAQHDARIGNVVLTNGGIWTSDRAVTNYDVLLANVESGAATVAVTGTGTAIMDGIGGIHLQGVQNFAVEDSTGDSATDLDVSMILAGPGTSAGAAGGINKTGAGTMFMSGFNTYTGTTTVAEGCLSILDLNAVPADLSLVSVATGAGFGGIVGIGLTDADIQNMVDNVSWDPAGGAYLVIDTDGADVTVAANITGNIGIIKKGDGVLTLTGNNTYTGGEIILGGSIETGSPAITVASIIRDASAQTVTIGFSSTDGNVDVYASPNLQVPWTKVGTDVAPSTFVETGVTDTERFYNLVPTGVAFP